MPMQSFMHGAPSQHGESMFAPNPRITRDVYSRALQHARDTPYFGQMRTYQGKYLIGDNQVSLQDYINAAQGIAPPGMQQIERPTPSVTSQPDSRMQASQRATELLNRIRGLQGGLQQYERPQPQIRPVQRPTPQPAPTQERDPGLMALMEQIEAMREKMMMNRHRQVQEILPR